MVQVNLGIIIFTLFSFGVNVFVYVLKYDFLFYIQMETTNGKMFLELKNEKLLKLL